MRRFAGILGLVLAAGLVFSNIELSAQDSTKTRSSAMQAQRRVNFVDENANGICDRFEQGMQMRPADHHMGSHGQNFIDENGDGICDHAGTERQNHGHRSAGHHGSRRGR